MRKIILLTVFLLGATYSFAANAPAGDVKTGETAVEAYSMPFTFRYGVGTVFPSVSMLIGKPNDRAVGKFTYEGNQPLVQTVTASLNGMGFSFSYDKFKGAKYVDSRFFTSGGHFGIDAIYQRYSGFSMSDPAGYSDPGVDCQNRPDMKIQSFNSTVFVSTAPERFSYDAALHQTAHQKAAGWSIFLGLSPAYSKLDASMPLVPAPDRQYYGREGGLKSGVFYSLAFSLGGGFAYAHGPLYTGFSGYFGLGPAGYSYRTADRKESGVTYSIKGDLKYFVGLDWEHFFTGFVWIFDGSDYALHDADFESTAHQLEFFAGSRF